MTTKYRINLKDAVDDLAPPSPKCFVNHIQWREYLQSAAAAQNVRGEPKVILIASDGAAAFNRNFPFCVDCTQIKSFEMMAKGLCNPSFLKENAALRTGEGEKNDQ